MGMSVWQILIILLIVVLLFGTKKLRNVGVNVVVFEAKDGLDTPDAHFPNNWISFHENRIIIMP